MMPDKLPAVSVITVVRNGEAYLAEAIESILTQTVWPAQILVVDGQSTDRTAQIAQCYQDVEYLIQEGTGLADARNLGLRCAQGEFIAFLDHDDLWHPRKLELQLRRMREEPALGYTTTRMICLQVDDDPAAREWQRAAIGEPRTGPTPSTLMARRELFEQVGDFDPRYAIGCDSDWFQRARDMGIPTDELPEVLLHKRLHGSNNSRNAVRNRQDLAHIARRSILRRAAAQG